MVAIISNFIYEESGQGLAEYAFLLALVAMLCIGGLKLIEPSLSGPIDKIASELQEHTL